MFVELKILNTHLSCTSPLRNVYNHIYKIEPEYFYRKLSKFRLLIVLQNEN